MASFSTLSFFTVGARAAEKPSEFRAGFSARAIPTTEDTSIGGYGYGDRRKNPFQFSSLRTFTFRLFQAGQGVRDPIRVKAAYFVRDTEKLLWLSVDSVGITRDFYRDIVERLAKRGYREGEIFVSATHTHSGPGNLSRNFFWQVAAMDWFDRDFYRSMLDLVDETAADAEQNAVPAELQSLAFKTRGLQMNRRQSGDYVDPQARVLFARERRGGKWLGAVVNYAIHGTAHGPENLQFSADVPGAIEHELERTLGLPVALLVNGAEGDVAPFKNGAEAIGKIARRFSRQLANALPLLAPVEAKWSVQQIEATLPTAKLDTRKCTSFSVEQIRGGFSGYSLSRVFGSGGGVSVPLSPWVSSRANLWKIDLGAIQILTWPGEPTSSVGLDLRALAKEKGWSDPWIFALTNDYHAYFTSESEFAANTYESCFSLHGGKAAEAVLAAYRNLR